MNESLFTTRINGTGPGGNLFEIVGKARVLMRQLDITRADIDAFSKRVMAAGTYADAIAVVREWFPVDLDEDL